MSYASSAAEIRSLSSSYLSAVIGWRCGSPPHSVTWPASISELKSMMSPGLTFVPGSTSSLPVGKIATRGFRRTSRYGWPHAAAAPRSTGLRILPWQHQLGRHNVLAHRADVLPRRHRRHDLDLVVAVGMDVLDHDDGVHARWQRIAGVDPLGLR